VLKEGHEVVYEWEEARKRTSAGHGNWENGIWGAGESMQAAYGSLRSFNDEVPDGVVDSLVADIEAGLNAVMKAEVVS